VDGLGKCCGGVSRQAHHRPGCARPSAARHAGAILWHTRRVAVDHLERRGVWVVAVVAVLAGLALGALDLLAQRTLPYPWANLANSSATWAIGAFAMGFWVRSGRWLPAFGGVVLLVVAVESYYLAATLVQNDDLANLWTASTLLWLVFGVLAGAVFGTAGGWARGRNRRLRGVGLALPGAVLLAEAAVLVYRSGNVDEVYRTHSLQTAAIEAVLGVVLVLLFARGTRQRLEGLAISVPLAAAGFGGFVLAGFGG
jgi:hypothetical protein